jgi:hypothetical protein
MGKQIKTSRLSAVTAALTPAWTREERLRRIEAMGQRIQGYVQFMIKVGDLKGSSDEEKEKAVESFYDRMNAMESQLGRILEDLQLG